MAMSFVTDELSPSFSSVRVIVTCSVSTMNADTPRALRVALSVRANRISVPPSEAFVIHCFAPVMCQPPSTALARCSSAHRRPSPSRTPSARSSRRARRGRAAARNAPAARRSRTGGSATCTPTCAPRPSHRRRHRHATAPRARARTTGSPRRRRRTPPARTRHQPELGRASRAAHAGNHAHGPTRTHAARSRPERTRGRAPGSRAAPA